jgi:hypothetical protein
MVNNTYHRLVEVCTAQQRTAAEPDLVCSVEWFALCLSMVGWPGSTPTLSAGNSLSMYSRAGNSCSGSLTAELCALAMIKDEARGKHRQEPAGAHGKWASGNIKNCNCTRRVQSKYGATAPLGAQSAMGSQETKMVCKGDPLSTMGFVGLSRTLVTRLSKP